jgi:hypothetical protein
VKSIDNSFVAKYDNVNGPEAKRFSGLIVGDLMHQTKGFGLQSAMETFDKEQFDSVLSVLDGIKSTEARAISIVMLCRRYLKIDSTAKPAKSVAAK